MVPVIASLKAGWSRSSDSNAGLIAAGIAYYGFLALVPMLAAAILTYGLVVEPSVIAEHGNSLSRTLPGGAGELVAGQLDNVAARNKGSSGLGLMLAIALALFGARVAAGALITAIDMAFAIKQDRGFIASNLLALAITFGAVLALGLMAGITTLVSTVLAGSGGAFASYVLVGLAGFGGAYLAYRVLPRRDVVGRNAAMRGSGLFALGWLAASIGFGFYASNFGNYDATYGSLGAVVVFLTWLWLSAFLLLLGAHVAAASAPDAD
ncbi:YihY/virulence factor BrkB family protein [Erythrobacter sp. R86502]|uniref:YihY/virulence factor BrkB family protein n=1 Tax=Erythrobacter sp. R86502 TaxID=3093846 RepID=UPI0036D3EA26